MDSNQELVAYLKSLSPFFNNLVAEAINLEIAILNQEDYFAAAEPFFPDIRRADLFAVFGAADFQKIGLGKIIVFEARVVKKYIAQGSLGFCERAFAHELGHILTWPEHPKCISNGQLLECFVCQFSEARADETALRLVERLHPDGNAATFLFEHKLLFFKQLLSKYRQGHHGYFSQALDCDAIAFHKLPACPKINEIKRIEQKLLCG